MRTELFGLQTPTLTTSLLAVTLQIATTLLPSATNSVPKPPSLPSYERNAFIGNQYYWLVEAQSKQQYQFAVLQRFATTLFNNMQDMDADIAKLTNDKFREMYEQF